MSDVHSSRKALRWALTGLGLLACASLLVSGSAAAAGESIAVFGEELTPEQHQEVAQIFGPAIDGASQVSVSHDDLFKALSGAGLAPDPQYQATSSSLLTCLNKGEGLTVKTQNITHIPAAAYANALVTAGVGDGNVLIAGPASHPLTGETALVGALQAFPQCQAGKQPDAKRVNLAYQQLANTVDLAGDSNDLTAASNVMLKASQSVVTGQAKDDATIGPALDTAAADEGIDVPSELKPKLVGFMKQLSGLDYGTYAKGFQVQQLSPTEARVVAAGSGSPAQAKPGSTGANGATFTGTVRQPGDSLVVSTNGQDKQVAPAPEAVVTRDGQPATIGDIRSGDHVSVTQAPDGTTQRIDANSKSTGTDGWKWLPLLIVPLLLAALWAITRRRRDAFVLERTPARMSVARGERL